ncbi:MAG: ylbJ, partial [Firmicutes bacterium]|nr:ylbJ [Bacillota bacterium]
MRTWGSGRHYRSRLLVYFMAFCTVFITITMVTYPKDTFDSA